MKEEQGSPAGSNQLCVIKCRFIKQFHHFHIPQLTSNWVISDCNYCHDLMDVGASEHQPSSSLNPSAPRLSSETHQSSIGICAANHLQRQPIREAGRRCSGGAGDAARELSSAEVFTRHQVLTGEMLVSTCFQVGSIFWCYCLALMLLCYFDVIVFALMFSCLRTIWGYIEINRIGKPLSLQQPRAWVDFTFQTWQKANQRRFWHTHTHTHTPQQPQLHDGKQVVSFKHGSFMLSPLVPEPGSPF